MSRLHNRVHFRVSRGPNHAAQPEQGTRYPLENIAPAERDSESGTDAQFLARGAPNQASMLCAAALPSATASTTSLPPFVQSPPAKYFCAPV